MVSRLTRSRRGDHPYMDFNQRKIERIEKPRPTPRQRTGARLLQTEPLARPHFVFRLAERVTGSQKSS